MEVNPSVSESQWERDINLCVSILYRQPFCTCAFPGPNPGESHTMYLRDWRARLDSISTAGRYTLLVLASLTPVTEIELTSSLHLSFTSAFSHLLRHLVWTDTLFTLHHDTSKARRKKAGSYSESEDRLWDLQVGWFWMVCERRDC